MIKLRIKQIERIILQPRLRIDTDSMPLCVVMPLPAIRKIGCLHPYNFGNKSVESVKSVVKQLNEYA